MLHLRSLPRSRQHDVLLEPDAAERADIATELGILGVKKLRFSGALEPRGKADWHLKATLGATVVQACVVTLDPVTSRIDEDVERSYLANPPALPEAAEVEMPEDDTAEALPETLDLKAVMVEALSLALPAYPRSDGAVIEGGQVAEPGVAPMSDEDAKPFAGLKDLRDKLEGGTE